MASEMDISAGRLFGWNQARRFAFRAVIFALFAYHAGLFIVHVLDGRVTDPATSLRWMVGALLMAGFLALQRIGVPLYRGRRAVVLWLLVLLLHCYSTPSAPESQDASLFLPTTMASLGVGAVGGTLAGLGLLLLMFLRRRAQALLRSGNWRSPGAPPSPTVSATGFVFAFAPRPPPSD